MGRRNPLSGGSRPACGIRSTALQTRSVEPGGHQRKDGDRRDEAGGSRSDEIQAHPRQGPGGCRSGERAAERFQCGLCEDHCGVDGPHVRGLVKATRNMLPAGVEFKTGETVMRRMFNALVSIAIWAVVFAPGAGRAQGAETVKVGVNKVISDIVFYIAEERGFFAEQKLKVELISFDSGPRMIAPLGAGQIDVGAGASSAGLYNAVSRGIIGKIVADKGSPPPGYDYMPLIVRKDLVDSGRVKSFADLKGLKLAAAGPGSATNAKLSLVLTKGGLQQKDAVEVNLSYPQQVAALTSKAIDGSITTEPSASNAISSRVAVRLSDDSLYPGQQGAALLYGDALLTTRRAVGQRFMNAYVKAARVYNDATRGGRFDGPGADQVIDLIMKTTGLTDRTMSKTMVPNGISPDGQVNMTSLTDDLRFFQTQGQIEKPVTATDVVDMSFAENAVKQLGPYEPAR